MYIGIPFYLDLKITRLISNEESAAPVRTAALCTLCTLCTLTFNEYNINRGHRW